MPNFAETLKDVSEAMESSEDELSAMMDSMMSPSMPNADSQPPKLLELIQILQSDPILIPPILELVKIKQAEIVDAKGKILYGVERWEAMKEQMRSESVSK